MIYLDLLRISWKNQKPRMYQTSLLPFLSNITSCLCIALFIIPLPSAYAIETVPSQVIINAETNEDADDEDEYLFQVTPVEIGPSGIIRKENVYRSLIEFKHPVHFHTLWETRYVTEGRDNLQGDSLISATTELSSGNLTFAPWLAFSPDQDYEELNLNFIYGFEITDILELYVSYSYLHAWEGAIDNGDNEIALELAISIDDIADVSVAWIHSTEANGNYYELALRKQNNINQDIAFNGGLVIGINQGYIVDGHEGVDHAQIRLGMAYHSSAQYELVAYISHSHAINKNLSMSGDTNLKNYSLGGVGFTWRF